MLKKKEISAQNVDTFFGRNSYFEGSFKTAGLLRIDGKFEGDIDVDGDIIVGKDGLVKGTVKAKNIEISGIVEGNINSSEQVKISSSGKLVGDIEVGSFVIEEKGVFDGKCKMKNEDEMIKESSKVTEKSNNNEESKKVNSVTLQELIVKNQKK